MTDSQYGCNSLLIVLSGPSGVGKDAVLNKMREEPGNYHFTVTATTREMREEETAREDYIFLSRAQFENLIDDEGFMEWSEVYGNLYGVPKSQVTDALSKGKNVIVKIDVQGAKKIKNLAPQAVFIFLSPPSMESLQQRLTKRMTESPEALALRRETANLEMLESKWFHYTVVNKDNMVDETVNRIEQIVKEELSLNQTRNRASNTDIA